MADPLDEPEGEAMELVMPFIVCQSNGGPYDDESFVAGFQAGEINYAMKLLAQIGVATRLHWPIVRSALKEQIDLMAMQHGFGAVKFEASDAYPEWGTLTVERGDHG